MAAATATRAGELLDRFLIARRALDENGDRLGDWGADAITVAAKVTPLKGSEPVLAARLQGEQPAILTVRVSAAARLIDNSFRAIDTRDWTRVYDVTSAELSADRAFVEILAMRKVGQTNG